jgi:DsbC/DsbD-like thiol-disulfide interchange protein
LYAIVPWWNTFGIQRHKVEQLVFTQRRKGAKKTVVLLCAFASLRESNHPAQRLPKAQPTNELPMKLRHHQVRAAPTL